MKAVVGAEDFSEPLAAYQQNWIFFNRNTMVINNQFIREGHNRTLHQVIHNFHLKIRNILELKTRPVEFETTCPSIIFLLLTGSPPP